MISSQKGAVSIWLRTQGARRSPVEIVGAFDATTLVETGDDDDGEALYFQWRECPSSESFYGHALHAVRALGLPDEPPGTYVLYDHACATERGPVPGVAGLAFAGTFAYVRDAARIGDRIRDDDDSVAVWIETTNDAFDPDEYIGWFDEDFAERGGGRRAPVAELLRGCSYDEKFADAAIASANALGVVEGWAAFVLYHTRFDATPGPTPYAPGVIYLGSFACSYT